MKHVWRPLFIALAAALLLGTPIVRRARSQQATNEAKNIILITFDALRKDRLGSYGLSRNTTPTIDTLAAEGLLVDGVRADSPSTFPSHLTILTGVPVIGHGSTYNGQPPGSFPDDGPLDELRRRGWRTAGVVSSFVLSAQYGLTRYFSDWDDGNLQHEPSAYREPDVTTTAAQAMLKRLVAAAQPFFLWVHYFAPHAPYVSPPEFAAQIGLGRPVPPEALDFLARLPWRLPTSAHVTALQDAYDARLAFADFQLGRLLSTVDALGLRSNTVMYFTADHGEELGEHDLYGEHQTILQSTMAVPFIVAGPGITRGRLPTLASTTQIAGTFLSLLGLGPDRSDGLLATGSPEDRTIVHLDAIAAMKVLLVRECDATLRAADADSLRSRYEDCALRLRQLEAQGYEASAVVRTADGLFELVRQLHHVEHRSVPSSTRLFELRDDPLERINRLGTHREIAVQLNQAIVAQYPELSVTGTTVAAADVDDTAATTSNTPTRLRNAFSSVRERKRS